MKLKPNVLSDVIQNSLHILGKTNNPSNWGKNKQGLVMGMVQSGKTVSMLSLMGMAMEAGYDLFIFLAGTKEDLRKQSQKRINDAFNLHMGGFSEPGQGRLRIFTPTYQQKFSEQKGKPEYIFQANENSKIIITVLK